MSEFGGAEILGPGEGASGAPEALSEEAKQRFAAAAAATMQIQREEKRSKKRDARVARTILQFLNDDRYAHLFILISRLVARDCPSVFILAILSLIDKESKAVVQEYLQELGQKSTEDTVSENVQLIEGGKIGEEVNRALVEWITRMQMILNMETQQILEKLMIDESNIDGTVLQLTTFVLQEFFRMEVGGRRDIPFEQLHTLAGNVLQTVFEPFLDAIDRKLLQRSESKTNEDDE